MNFLKKGIFKWIIGALVVLVFAFFGFTAEVREGESAVITRFGAVREEITEAGLYFKLPWPFENVTKYDARNQYTESSYLETLTQDKRNIILQSYAVWSVSDPLKYHNAVGDNAVAELRINELIINASNSVMGKYELLNVVSNDESKLRLPEIENAIFEDVKAHALARYGIEVGDVGIMKISLPEDEVPCTDVISPTGYYATTNYTGFLSHVKEAGAGYLHTLKDGNYWTIDEAGRDVPYQNWAAGKLEWKVPIGWRRFRSDDEKYGIGEYADYERHNDKASRPLLIGNRNDMYKQIFTIESDGTASVSKFGYKLSRSRWWLKGTVEKE